MRANWLLKHLANEIQKEYIISIGEDKIGYKGQNKLNYKIIKPCMI